MQMRCNRFLCAGIALASLAFPSGRAHASPVCDYAFRPTASSSAKARDFVENQKSFRLGFLPTERSNPITASLERPCTVQLALNALRAERSRGHELR